MTERTGLGGASQGDDRVLRPICVSMRTVVARIAIDSRLDFRHNLAARCHQSLNELSIPGRGGI